jgi:xanthine dehydrogenase accessory factor
MGSVTALRIILDEVTAGRRAALATVVRTDRSTPRRHGASMVVLADGTRHGTVGGGEMEARVVEAAQQCLEDGRPRLITYRLVDPASGDPGVCGGEMDVYVEPYMREPTLLIIGAGHVGRAVCELAQWSGWRPVLWDDRPEQLEAFTDPVQTFTSTISDMLDQISVDAATAIVVVTRNVELDRTILPPLLTSGAGYIGLMGSARRWSTTRDLLIDDGITEDALDRVQTPIGVEIGAETPEEIAISIMAEVVKTFGER